jgi:hypothetical protein
MKKLLIVILTVVTLSVAGQKHLIGVKGGVNITNVSLPNLSNDTKNRVSYIRGLTYEYLLNNSFSLSADLLLDLRGFHYEVPMYDDLGHPTGYSGTTREDFAYLSFPLKAGYNIGDNLYGYVNLGVIPAILLNSVVTIPIGSLLGDRTYNNYSNNRKFDISALIELGGGYSISERIRLCTSISFQNSLMSATLPEDGDLFELTHYGMTITAGIKYTLMK